MAKSNVLQISCNMIMVLDEVTILINGYAFVTSGNSLI